MSYYTGRASLHTKLPGADGCADTLLLQNPAGSQKLEPLPSALVGAGHDQIPAVNTSAIARPALLPVSTGIGKIRLEVSCFWSEQEDLCWFSQWYTVAGLVGGQHRRNFMSGWQPEEVTGEKTHQIPHGVCPTPSNLPWCMGWGLTVCRGEKGTHIPGNGRGILCSSMSHWLILRGTLALRDRDCWRPRAPSTVPRVSEQGIWCKLVLAISDGKGEIQHTWLLWCTRAVTPKLMSKAGSFLRWLQR